MSMTPEQTIRSTDKIATIIRAQIAAATDARIDAGVAYAAAVEYDGDALLNATAAATAAVNEIVGALISYIAYGFIIRRPSTPLADADALTIACHDARRRAIDALPTLSS